MPYSGISDKDLPKNVQDLPKHQREIWVATFNSAQSSCLDKGEKSASKCESSAFAIAWAAVNKQKDKERVMNESRFRKLLRSLIRRELYAVRTIKEVTTWDGSASNYKDTNSFCAACLIDVNTGDTKDQAHCMLPVREQGDGSDVYVKQAVHACAGGHGLSQVKKPDDVSDADWNAATKKAANEIIKAYGEMDEQAPDAIYMAAGKEVPQIVEEATSYSVVPETTPGWDSDAAEQTLAQSQVTG